MEQSNNFLSEFEEKEKTGTLKVLTILTFIGGGIAFLSAIWSFFTAQTSYETMQKMYDDGTIDKMPSFVKGMYTPEMLEMTRKSAENRIPICLIGVIAAALCIIGAIKMRQRKADGYWMWLIGEILPFFAIIFFIGAAAFHGIFMWVGIIITLVFVALYTSQRKHLTK